MGNHRLAVAITRQKNNTLEWVNDYDTWLYLFTNYYDCPEREYEPEERITIYRGACDDAEKEGWLGIAWTTDRNLAAYRATERRVNGDEDAYLMVASIRRAFCMEFDPKYVDVIIRRWEEFTGKDAILEGSNKTFEEAEAIGKE